MSCIEPRDCSAKLEKCDTNGIFWEWRVLSMKANMGCYDFCQHIKKIFLYYWGRVTHICVGNLTIIGPDNGLSPGRRQAIIWTNAEILLIEPWGTNFSEILIGIQPSSFRKMHLKMSSLKWRPICLGLNVIYMPAAYFTPVRRYIPGTTMGLHPIKVTSLECHGVLNYYSSTSYSIFCTE